MQEFDWLEPYKLLTHCLPTYEPLATLPTTNDSLPLQEFDCLEAYQLALFAIGICIMFAGLFVLSAEAAKVAQVSR